MRTRAVGREVRLHVIRLQKPFLLAFRRDVTSSPRMSAIEEEGGGEMEGQRVSQRFLPNRLPPSLLLKQRFFLFSAHKSLGRGGSVIVAGCPCGSADRLGGSAPG